MTVLPDGKILVLGTTTTSTNFNPLRDIVLMRLNSDGSLDTSFNETGILTIIDPVEEGAGALVYYPNGKILIGGYRSNGSRNDFLLMRLNANGSIDTSFGNGGRTVTLTSTSGYSSQIESLGLQSNGKIVAGGSGFLTRYTEDGILDTSFASNGIADLETLSEMRRFRILDNDKILVAVKYGANSGVVRYMPDGARDMNFNGGAINIRTQGYACVGQEVDVLSDGKMLLVGQCSDNVPKFAVHRLLETRTKRHLDFTGDERTEISIYRRSNGQWWYLDNSTVQTQIVAGTFGTATDKPVQGDYTGDGKSDAAFWRPSTGQWFVLRSEDSSYFGIPFGLSDDLPAPGQFAGDAKYDFAVFRPSENRWHVQTNGGTYFYKDFGSTGDIPLPNLFVP